MSSIIRIPGAGSIIKLVLIAFFLLLFFIPLSMIRSLVNEREARYHNVSNEVINGQGGASYLFGPLVVIPYDYTEIDDKGILRDKSGKLFVLPDNLNAVGTMNAQYRHRGIYKVPVYKMTMDFTGSVSLPPANAFPEGAEIRNSQVMLVTGIENMHGIREVSSLNWDGNAYSFLPDVGNPTVGSGISVDFLNLPTSKNAVDFSWTMEISGGGSVSIVPLGRDSELHLTGDWPSPSFQGARLPDERKWDNTGFEAHWYIPEVSRPIRRYWDSREEIEFDRWSHTITVELFEPVGSYARIFRSVKFGLLILILPFAVFFLFEMLGKKRIHPAQYVLAGAADVVFYLLLLAISEHWGFDVAYLTAAFAVTVLLGAYARPIMEKKFFGLAMPSVMAGAYLWLWISIQSEDYALLIGSIGVFILITTVMAMTRKVEWYADTSS